jgi:pantetheine-phosphate adenylyltransferase
VLGGTFAGLHAGHRRLLAAAFEAAESVGIGLTTEAYLRGHPKPRPRSIPPYAARRRTLVRYLARHWPRRRWRVVPLADRWGGSVEPGVDLLVASVETREGVRSVNAERRRRGLPPVRTLLIPLVRGEDGRPIASRRIRAGEIDPEGHRLRPIRLAVRARGRGLATWTRELENALRPMPVHARGVGAPRARGQLPRGGRFDLLVELPARRSGPVRTVTAEGSRRSWQVAIDRETGLPLVRQAARVVRKALATSNREPRELPPSHRPRPKG